MVIDRVIEELELLTIKAKSLKMFLSSKEFRDLPIEQRHLLGQQLEVMRRYRKILISRLELLTGGNHGG